MSEPIQLVRKELRDGWCDTRSANLSLLLQKGFIEIEHPDATKKSDEETKKFSHLNKMANLPAPSIYQRAFNRWFDHTSNENRFSQTVMTLENRLLIGLTGNAALETGCSLSRNYGMPYIPGSSIKGVIRAWAKQYLPDSTEAIDQLLGTDDSDQPNRVSGTVIFHDAWWIPFNKDNTQPEPFVLDVVTTHHQAYYNGNQAEPSDKDSPIPNHLLAVKGSFLFVIEGDPEHIKLCQSMLIKALESNGIGTKTAAGYGYCKDNNELLERLIDDSLQRSNLNPKTRAQREAQKQRKAETKQKQEEVEQQKIELQAREEQAKAERDENEKSVEDVIRELEKHYKKEIGSEEYRIGVEKRIDYAIHNWSLDQRLALAQCLKDLDYIPTNKKNKNRELRKARLKQLREE